jgi:hypothetical protein
LIKRIITILLFSIVLDPIFSEPRPKGISGGEGEAKKSRRIALVIGINEYKDVGLQDLRKARNDAKGIAKILIQNGEFDLVTLMTDETDPKDDPDSLFPTKLNVDEKLDSLLMEAGPEDLFLFYFSGHGVSDYEEKSFLLTQDSILSKPFNSSLSVESVVQKIGKKGIKNSLLFLDACRDSMYTSKNTNTNPLNDKVLLDGEIFGILYSTKAGFFSYEDDESSYGVFTKYLIYALEGRADINRDKKVTFSELENYITAAVKDWSIRKNKQQKPYTKYFGEKSGDIVLSYPTNPDISLADVPVNNQNRESVWIRSILYPGWGQYYQGDTGKGKLYLGIASFLLVATFDSYVHYRKAKAEYDSFIGIPPTTRFGESFLINSYLLEPKQNALDTTEKRFEQTSLLFGLFYVWNLVDLAFYPYKPNEPTNKLNFSMQREVVPFQSGIYSQSNRYEISYQFHF